MHPDQLDIQMMDYVCGHMNPDEQAEFERFLQNNPDAQAEMEALRQTLQMVDDDSQIPVPEPSAAMDTGFYQMLNTAQKQQRPGFFKRMKSAWNNLLASSYFKPALSGVSMLVVGFFVGSLYTQSTVEPVYNNLNTVSNNDRNNEFQAMTVSLLDLPSASKRLQAVNMIATRDNTIEPIVLAALLETLNNDGNVNVRLAVVETLSQYAEVAAVRQGLVAAIPNQQSPMVQVALANLMLKLNEKEAIKPFQDLLEGEQLIEPVKAKLTYTVNELI